MSRPAAGDPDLPRGAGSGTSIGADGWPAWRRVAIGGGGGMFVGIGLGRFSYTAMVPALISSGELTALEAGRVGTLNIAGFAFGALISVPLRARLKEYPTLVTAILLSVVALIASAAPLGFAWLGFWRCVVGATAGIIMVLSLALIAATAPAARRPVAASFVFAGVGLAILSAGTLVPLLLRLGLPAAWLGLGGCAIGAAAAAIWGWRAAPVHHAPPVGQTNRGPCRRHGLAVEHCRCACCCSVISASRWRSCRTLSTGWTTSRAASDRASAKAGSTGASSVSPRSLGPWVAAWIGLMLGTAWALPVSFLALGIGIAAPILSSATIVLLASSLLFGAQPGLSDAYGGTHPRPRRCRPHAAADARHDPL